MKYFILDRVQLLIGAGLYIYLFYLSSLETRAHWETPLLGVILWIVAYIILIKYFDGKNIFQVLENTKDYIALVLLGIVLTMTTIIGIFYLIYVLCNLTAQAIMTLSWILSWITLPIAILCFAYWMFIGYVFIKAFSPKGVSNE